jgi:ribA/ribD-fused uncharacterized protein
MSNYHGLDNANSVFFYEQEFYVLSNFSSFVVGYGGKIFPTVEHAYHWAKFVGARHYAFDSGGEVIEYLPSIQELVQERIAVAPSAHEAYVLAHKAAAYVCPYWGEVKVQVMRELLWDKVTRHEYVRRKLLETGGRELVENSWRDDYWGWGPNRDGRNELGKLWVGIRTVLQEEAARSDSICPGV